MRLDISNPCLFANNSMQHGAACLSCADVNH